MTRKARVYLAMPYTGDGMGNIRRACLMATHLMERFPTITVYLPHLTGLWDLLCPQSYEHWMAYDADWLEACDILFRGPGVSGGADREVGHAYSLRMPVCFSEEQLAEALASDQIRALLGDTQGHERSEPDAPPGLVQEVPEY